MYPYIAPENFENSKISSISNDQLSLKVSDLLQQKEITKYIQSKEELIQIFEKYCEFFKFSEDKEKIQYILPEGMTVFSILNIPPKLNKEEVKNHIELINLQYNRLYKRGFYWILSTIDKETVICVQNSLRELIFDEVRIKYIHNNKNQILKSMKDKMDKNIYQKESKYLGINNSNNYSRNNYKKGKASDSDYKPDRSLDFSDHQGQQFFHIKTRSAVHSHRHLRYDLSALLCLIHRILL